MGAGSSDAGPAGGRHRFIGDPRDQAGRKNRLDDGADKRAVADPLAGPHTGGVSITGTATENQVLTAVSTMADSDGMGTLHYQWQRDVGGGFVNVGADQATYTLGDADVGGIVRVIVSYTDGAGNPEVAASAATPAIANVNDPHTGGVSITGTATENQVLTAVSTLADADGMGTLHYQWQRNVGAGFFNVGADQATYTLGDADVGGVVRVIVSYTDGEGTAESATSASTASIANVNDPHTGGVSITGTATENQVLTAVSTMADPDGMGTLHYQWQRDVGGGFVNVGADQATYTLGDADVGGIVRVIVSYTDGGGTAESAASAATPAIANVNDPRTGGVTITGTATENQVLTANTSTLADADGLGTLHYQWQRNTGSGFVNVGADQATYTLGDADVGGIVRVIVSYTDQNGTAEAATSAASPAIANVNDPHTGGASVTGTATENQVLTAVSTMGDADGMGTLHYQWQRNTGSGFVNVGADQATYTLGDADVGGIVRVVISYTDGQGTAESATSAATASIANVNDPHTGGASVTGTATEDQVLTAVSTLADADGMGTLHYQWQRNTGSGFVNVGLDQATYTLGDADVGGVVRVVISYTDQNGSAESATSAATAAVANVNDPAVAANDAVSATESAIFTGNVFSNNGSGVDSDPDGPALAVSAVNGSAAAVGNQIALASGALLKLNANGTFDYNPNGAFDFLPGSGSGASNQTYADTFTYTLVGGGTATVTVTVQGQDSDGDYLFGSSSADTLNGGVGDDVIDGAGGDDLIFGGAGVDSIFGGEGADTIHGGDATEEDVHGDGGNDILHSGGEGHYSGDAGDDLIFAGLTGGPQEVLDGGSGVDTLDTRTWDDVYIIDLTTGATNYGESFLGFENVITGGGDDAITGGAADNVIRTNGGNDTLDGLNGADTLAGGAGNDALNGGDGIDTADYSAAAAAVTARLDTGVASNDGDGGSDTLSSIENLIGSVFNDTLFGSSAANIIRGGEGRDVILGFGGNDVIHGGSGVANEVYGGQGDDIYVVENRIDTIVENAGEGTDTVETNQFQLNLSANVENLTYTGTGTFTGVGNAQNNVIRGGALRDVLIGGGGADTLIGGSGAANELYGGLGDDVFVLDVADSIIESAGQGTDTVQLRDLHAYVLSANIENVSAVGNGAFSVAGNALANTLTGGAGADTLQGRGGVDVLAGGGGTDTASYILAAAGVTARLDIGAASNDGEGGTDTFSSIENLLGSNLRDTLFGDAGANVIDGAIGNDVLLGLGGNDTLIGGSGGGNNEMYGGLGDDLYIVNAGDTLIENAGEGIDTVQTTVAAFTLKANIENMVYVGPAGFAGTGNASNNVITGAGGADSFSGLGGDDTFHGGLGTDVALLRGVQADYLIEAVAGGYRITDSVAGRDGVDLLYGMEQLRFSNGATLTLPAASPPAPEVKGDGDAFVLPALPDDQPLVLPGEALAKGNLDGDPLVLPGDRVEAGLLAGLVFDQPLIDRPLPTGADDSVVAHDRDWM